MTTNYTASIHYTDCELATVEFIKEHKIVDGAFYFAGVDFEMWIPMTSVKSVIITEDPSMA